jgi:hypothetical protein
MMFKIRQGLTLQQSPKHPGLFHRFFHENQVLNLTEDHHPLDPIHWELILEVSKLSGVLEDWVFWIHEKIQLDQLGLVSMRPINFVHLLHLGNKRNGKGGGFLRTEGGKEVEDLKNLLMAIVGIDFLQQKCDHSALC